MLKGGFGSLFINYPYLFLVNMINWWGFTLLLELKNMYFNLLRQKVSIILVEYNDYGDKILKICCHYNRSAGFLVGWLETHLLKLRGDGNIIHE